MNDIVGNIHPQQGRGRPQDGMLLVFFQSIENFILIVPTQDNEYFLDMLTYIDSAKNDL